MPLTDHQELAAESRGGARLVSAAAGSGKTKVLVERLMRYVDRGADIDQFLVITYTRAAAAELRSRILSALGERIAADPMNRRLRRQTELCCRASIGTIDSICGRFLRENTHLAGISPDYRVIEPDRSDEICARVLDKLLEELYETIEEDAGVRALVDSFGSGDNDDRLSALVLRLYKSLQSHADPDAWLAEQRERLTDAWNDAGDTPWGQYLLSRTRSQAQYWAERIEELRRRLDEPDRDAKIKKAYTNNLDFAGDAARDMARAAALGWDKARLACPGSFPRRGIYKGDDPLAQRIIAVWTGFKDTAAKWQELFANDSDALLRDLAVNTPAVDALLALTQKLGTAFAAEKKRQGVCDFSDQEHLVLKLLMDSSNGLAAALSSRYTEVLVDEYQDVNACQDALFRLLSDNGRKLFMVGDVKQSIYRFRLADPTIFLKKYETWPDIETAEPCEEPGRILLRENFRSRPEVLESANHVFRNIMSRELGELEYDEAAALRPGPGRDFPVGGGAPVSIQSMLNTRTTDVEACLAQIRALAAAGCEIARLAVPDMEAAETFGAICAASPLPLVADIHFDYRLAIRAAENGKGESQETAKTQTNGKGASAHNSATLSKYANRIPFGKNMKDYTIVAPQMSPIHFSLVESVIRSGGYKFDILEHASREDVETGLKYVNNDACYPAIMVIGQLVDAILEGKYDPDHTALAITQTGGMCRATNYFGLIRKALVDAGYPQIPVIAISTQGIEDNPGFTATPALLHRAIKALIIGDLLMKCLYRVRPYEVTPGSANQLYKTWDTIVREALEHHGRSKTARKFISKGYLPYPTLVKEIVKSFDALPLKDEPRKVRVGVVGEILVKYQPDANNHVVDVIESQDCEAVVPGIMEFMTTRPYISDWNEHYLGMGGSKIGYALMRKGLDLYNAPVREAVDLAHGKFSQDLPMPELVKKADEAARSEG